MPESRLGVFSDLISRLKKVQCGKWVAVILLAAQPLWALPAGAGRRMTSAGLPDFLPAALLSVVPQAETPEAKGAAVSAPKAAAIQAAIAGVHSPSLEALARALGLNVAQIGPRSFDDSTIGMETVSGLGPGDVPVAAVKWRPAAPNASAETAPALYLLSWDGKGWEASYLTTATDALTVQVLPGSGDAGHIFAVILYRGVAAVPYPVVFRFQDHHALLAWDGRSDSASYTGYDYGSIQFKQAENADVPVMITAGRADPGLLVFPNSDQQSGRGFQAASLYVWKNDSYVPLRTEYTHNRDYLLYRFISALHLHEFKVAYSLIDAQRFLKTSKPTLKLFRTSIKNKWPEFIDDRIFEVPPGKGTGPDGYRFILRLGRGKVNVYHPTFTPGPQFRLAGLTRTVTHE